MRILTLSELIFINSRVVDSPELATGKRKVRDIDQLESAQQRPEASAFGADAYPSLAEKIAALAHSLSRNHPFTDGNKRTAALAALLMAEVNGRPLAWDETEALDLIVRMAQDGLTVPELAAWFEARMMTGPLAIEPDAERDMAAIDRLRAEHRSLLDALALR